jgi:hypothetical protein
MQLDKKAFALAAGIAWGVLIFLTTNASIILGGQGEHLSILALFYRGYSFSFAGSVIGFVWGFVTAAIGAWLFAWMYNKFARVDAKI